MNKRVVLISNDQKLGAILTIALADPDQLSIVKSARELPDSRGRVIDAVVLDLPADSRRRSYEQVRERFQGRLLVPVDSQEDTSDWPPDPDRRFLVRPFQLADLIAGVRDAGGPDQEPASRRRFLRPTRRGAATDEPAAQRSATAKGAARAGGKPGRPAEPERRDDTAKPVARPRTPVPRQGGGAAGPARQTRDPRAGPGQARAGPAQARAGPGQARVERPEPEIPSERVLSAMAGAVAAQRLAREQAEAAPQLAKEAEPERRKGVALRLVGAVATVLVVLLVGIAAGMLIGPDGPSRASPAPAPIVRERVVTKVGPPPPACLAAIDSANAALSYLINKIRDDRLVRSLDQYTANRRACESVGR
ncbi:MAG TPA: hypothetical protein VG276_12810 [Actinomycetes bacterium]|jgi:hypothetical protein|nr:hypothetical protein [Actinomycetes bacterium]